MRDAASTDRCQNCKFWEARPVERTRDWNDRRECRRRAPITAVSFPGDMGRGDPVWPVTWNYDGCGDFVAWAPKENE